MAMEGNTAVENVSVGNVAKNLEKDMTCQEICKTITQSVESTDCHDRESSISQHVSALLPDMNSDDDIENILQQISEFLGVEIDDNSKSKDADGTTDSLSVEDILKEAETLIRVSSPFYEKKSKPLDTVQPLFEPIRNNLNQLVVQQKKPVKATSHSVLPVTSSKRSNVAVNEMPRPATYDGVQTPTVQKPIGVGSEVVKTGGGLPVPPAAPSLQKSKSDGNFSKRGKLTEQKSASIDKCDGEVEREKASENDKGDRELTLKDLEGHPGGTFTVRAVIDKPEEHSKENTNDHSCFKDELMNALLKEINQLNYKVIQYQKLEGQPRKNGVSSNAERQQLALLQEEIKSQAELIEGYQNENQRLADDVMTAKETWKQTEAQLTGKVKRLEQTIKEIVLQHNSESDDLNNKLQRAYDLVTKLEMELDRTQEEDKSLRKINENLTVDVTRLNCEVEEYKKELREWSRHEREKLEAIENNAVMQGKLSQANTELTRKQTEIIRLNGEIGRLRGELEKIRLGSVVNHSIDTTATVSQLQAALAMERENCRDIAKERDALNKEIMDLRRQIKEMEAIIIKRSKSSSAIPFGDTSRPDSPWHKSKETELDIINTKRELNEKQRLLKELQNKHDQDLYDVEQQLKAAHREIASLKHLLEEQSVRMSKRNQNAASAKEDAHLLATIRGLKSEINSRDKDIMRLNKELDDARKTNKRLQKERERALNAGVKTRASSYTRESDKPGSRASSENSAPLSKSYNPGMFEDTQEGLAYLRVENRNLKEEIKRLEQDLVSLHNKRIQDMGALQEQHEIDMARLVREQATKHSSSTVTHLQSQLYTQQMIIHHQKEQIEEMERQLQEFDLIKSERDHLESTLIEANKKIARLHDLASPESVQYSSLLEKLEFLERRHEVREQKLQSIVRDLMVKQSQGTTCSSNCRDKLMNKNREICYYRAEMDKMLATLAELRANK